MTKISNTLVKNRKSLDYILKVGPVALNNLALAYDPNIGALDTRMDIGDNISHLTTDPTTMICSLLSGIPGVTCPKSATSSTARTATGSGAKGANQRTAPFSSPGQRNSTVPGFDPTLAGLVGVAK